MHNVQPGEKHFTASVWLITTGTPKKVLLLHHKKANSWFQPGGHMEQFENPLETAIREVKEETGIDITFLRKRITNETSEAKFLPIPEFFLEERIPAHKEQPEHFHLDLMYVVHVEEQKLRINIQESHTINWFTKEEALALSLLDNTKTIINKLL